MRIMCLFAAGLILGGCVEDPATRFSEPAMSLVLVAQVGEEASAGALPFGQIVDVELGADGKLFVLDGQSRIVSVFDSTGTPLLSFGGYGRGPGELDRPAGLFWDRAGRLWAFDLGTNRYSVFRSDGGLVGTYAAPGPQPFLPMTAYFGEEEVFRTVGIEVMGGSLEGPRAVLTEYRVTTEIEHVRQTELPFVQWPDPFELSTADIALALPIPFSPEPMMAIAPSGALWYGEAGSGLVHRWSVAGGFDRTVGRELPPLPLDVSTLEAALSDDPDMAEVRELFSPAAYADFLEHVPDVQPNMAAFFFGDDGSLWLLRAKESADLRPLDQYGTDGALVGVTEVNLSPVPRPRARGNRVAGVVRDDLGVESVVVYRVER